MKIFCINVEDLPWSDTSEVHKFAYIRDALLIKLIRLQCKLPIAEAVKAREAKVW